MGVRRSMTGRRLVRRADQTQDSLQSQGRGDPWQPNRWADV